MSAVYPPGGTIVQSLKRTFDDVPVDEANGNAVSTVEFLEASESLTTIFGTTISYKPQRDLNANYAFFQMPSVVLLSVPSRRISLATSRFVTTTPFIASSKLYDPYNLSRSNV